jgi:hypothetical protein
MIPRPILGRGQGEGFLIPFSLRSPSAGVSKGSLKV